MFMGTKFSPGGAPSESWDIETADIGAAAGNSDADAVNAVCLIGSETGTGVVTGNDASRGENSIKDGIKLKDGAVPRNG